ncbi:Cysteine--tRNA ligase OS=Streptomyces microflavus OX=1919 GN=cysS PE=3 SV=1 [Streptomyces microflavus]
MHNGWVTMAGEKMSKSLGNSVLVSEMVKQWRPIVLRYYLGTPHYRSMIEYSEESLREAESAFARIEGFVQRVTEKAGETVAPAAEVPPAFAEAMDEDLGVPQALAIVHTTVRQGNSALAADDKEAAVARLAEVRAMLGVLGLDPLDEHWAGEGDRGEDLHGVVDTLVRLVLDQRQSARARKDWAAADAIRDQLNQSGLVIEDSANGPRWTLGPR